MKTLSVRQPWASLIIHGLKIWETRRWKPGPRNLKIIQRDGLLIHASATKKDAWRMGEAPFSNYLSRLGPLPYGAIIGRVKIGRIITTAKWRAEYGPWISYEENLTPRQTKWTHEYQFGDYRPGRWAWEILEPEPISHIPWKGALSLWEFAYTPEEIQDQMRRDYGEPYDMEMWASL